MRSDTMKKGLERAPHRSLFKALGLTDREIEQPMIGIANSANEIIPGHLHLHQISEAVKAGIRMAGGHAAGVLHDRGVRRDRHGPRGDEVLPELPRADRRLRRVDGDGLPLRRPGPHPQLRQDRPRDADGRGAPRHPHHRDQRRPDALRRVPGKEDRSDQGLRIRGQGQGRGDDDG